MALIGMAVFSTAENKKDECLEKTLESLANTVDFAKHRIMLSVNAKTDRTVDLLLDYRWMIQNVFHNGDNIGTAEAINKVWKRREPGENAIKMDDDVVIHQAGWADIMEDAIARDPQLGIIGLKRRDCWEHTRHDDPELRSQLYQLPHIAGQRWITVEKMNHVMGTCQMYSSALLDKIGYLYQPKTYGYDDVLASHRSHIAGFYNCMLTGIDIEHIDEGNTPFQSWKEKHAGECTDEMIQTFREYKGGVRSIYYNPFI
jgi:GT2 family glycosyltransferase